MKIQADFPSQTGLAELRQGIRSKYHGIFQALKQLESVGDFVEVEVPVGLPWAATRAQIVSRVASKTKKIPPPPGTVLKVASDCRVRALNFYLEKC